MPVCACVDGNAYVHTHFTRACACMQTPMLVSGFVCMAPAAPWSVDKVAAREHREALEQQRAQAAEAERQQRTAARETERQAREAEQRHATEAVAEVQRVAGNAPKAGCKGGLFSNK